MNRKYMEVRHWRSRCDQVLSLHKGIWVMTKCIAKYPPMIKSDAVKPEFEVAGL